MVSADAIGSEPYPREQEIILQACFRLRVGSHKDQGYVASWFYLHGLSIGIEFAHQAIPVFLRGRCQMGDKGLNQLPTSFFKGGCAAEVGRVRLDQRGIEVVLAD